METITKSLIFAFPYALVALLVIGTGVLWRIYNDR